MKFEEIPIDPLVDSDSLSSFDHSGEEVDTDAFFARDPFLTPERRLAFSVLELAIDDYVKNANSMEIEERRLFQKALKWISSNDTTWGYSFIPLCHFLGIEEENIRGKLNRWRIENAPNSFQSLPPKRRKTNV